MRCANMDIGLPRFQTIAGLAEQVSTTPESKWGAWQRRTHTSLLARRAIGTPLKETPPRANVLPNPSIYSERMGKIIQRA
jgi:hypothetical protein